MNLFTIYARTRNASSNATRICAVSLCALCAHFGLMLRRMRACIRYELWIFVSSSMYSMMSCISPVENYRVSLLRCVLSTRARAAHQTSFIMRAVGWRFEFGFPSPVALTSRRAILSALRSVRFKSRFVPAGPTAHATLTCVLCALIAVCCSCSCTSDAPHFSLPRAGAAPAATGSGRPVTRGAKRSILEHCLRRKC